MVKMLGHTEAAAYAVGSSPIAPGYLQFRGKHACGFLVEARGDSQARSL